MTISCDIHFGACKIKIDIRASWIGYSPILFRSSIKSRHAPYTHMHTHIHVCVSDILNQKKGNKNLLEHCYFYQYY